MTPVINTTFELWRYLLRHSSMDTMFVCSSQPLTFQYYLGVLLAVNAPIVSRLLSLSLPVRFAQILGVQKQVRLYVGATYHSAKVRRNEDSPAMFDRASAFFAGQRLRLYAVILDSDSASVMNYVLCIFYFFLPSQLLPECFLRARDRADPGSHYHRLLSPPPKSAHALCFHQALGSAVPSSVGFISSNSCLLTQNAFHED